ncbi:hypothetical protein [Bradyrhizobium sp.]|uniref:hypothetical protein n=1 Tax=Bradyrhizobium sp. TaxID=376 RepID=UPI003C769562
MSTRPGFAYGFGRRFSGRPFSSPVEDESSEPIQGGDNQEHFGGQLQRIDENQVHAQTSTDFALNLLNAGSFAP